MSCIYKDRNAAYIPTYAPKECYNEIVETHALEYNKDHQIVVVKTGEKNIKKLIQSYANDTDYARIVRTIKQNNIDTISMSKVLQTHSPKTEIDVTGLPADIIEATQMISKSKSDRVKIEKSAYFKSKGIPFDDFVKQYSAKDHLEFLKTKNSAANKGGNE